MAEEIFKGDVSLKERKQETEKLPYEKLVNLKLGRTLTPIEIEAVEIFVQYGNNVSQLSEYYYNAVRCLIINGDIPFLIEFSNSPEFLRFRS